MSRGIRMGNLLSYAMDLIMEDRVDDAQEVLLAESTEQDLLQQMQSSTKMDYLMRIDAFFDSHDLYMYKGWEDAQILKAPQVDKFWITLDLRAPKETQLKGARRCCSAEEDTQNTVSYKQLEDGSYFVKFKILKRILDKIELDDQELAREIANKTDPTLG